MRSIYFLFLVFFIITGCVSRSDYTSRATPAQRVDLSISEEKALASNDFDLGQWPSREWWKRFNDPALTDCVELAIENNPSLKSAQSKVAEAFEQANITRAKLFPWLSLTADDMWEHHGTNTFDRFTPGSTRVNENIIQLFLNFNFDFDLWGKNRDAFKAAIGRAKSQLADQEMATLVISIAVAKEYFSLMAYWTKNDLLRDQLRERLRKLDVQISRFENELDPLMTPLSEDIDVQVLKNEIDQNVNEIELTIYRIKVLMGLSPDDEYRFDRRWDYDEHHVEIPENIGLGLVARRPDLRAQIWLVEAAAKEIGVARKAFYPDLNLVAQGGLESFFMHNFFKSQSLTGFLNPAVNLPLFERGALKGRLGAKKAAFEAAVYKYNSMVLSAAEEVSSQISNIISINKQIRNQFTQVKDQSGVFDLRMSRFTVGVDTILTVLDASDTLYTKKIEALSFEWASYMKSLQLIQALGGGYHTEQDFTYHEVER